MEFYQILIILLFITAIVDLIVGVSNDAVNYQTIDEQIIALQTDSIGNRIGLLQVRILLESKDIAITLQQLYMLCHDYNRKDKNTPG